MQRKAWAAFRLQGGQGIRVSTELEGSAASSGHGGPICEAREEEDRCNRPDVFMAPPLSDPGRGPEAEMQRNPQAPQLWAEAQHTTRHDFDMLCTPEYLRKQRCRKKFEDCMFPTARPSSPTLSLMK